MPEKMFEIIPYPYNLFSREPNRGQCDFTHSFNFVLVDLVQDALIFSCAN